MAVYAQEPRLLKIFSKEGDFHQMIAEDLKISRHAAKTVNYAMGYGAGVNRLAEEINVSHKRAQELHKGYRDSLPCCSTKLLKRRNTQMLMVKYECGVEELVTFNIHLNTEKLSTQSFKAELLRLLSEVCYLLQEQGHYIQSSTRFSLGECR